MHIFQTRILKTLSKSIAGPISSASLPSVCVMLQGSGPDLAAHLLCDLMEYVQLLCIFIFSYVKRMWHLITPELLLRAVIYIYALIKFRYSHG